ncbi:putative halogenase [Mycena olivaceomarginata]|nr:putative halogenase [Mycena olivaceomarginata]
MSYSPTVPPSSTQILVIGGGPSGAYTAAALAREGFQVTLLEKDNFPRYHIGETMLYSFRMFLRFIEAEEKVKNFGFAVKVGAAVKLNQHKREGYTDFTLGGTAPERASWSVTRADFDDLLLKHAAESGASVYEGVRVTEIKFSAENPRQPVAAEWKSDQGSGEIKFSYLVDGSGRTGIMSTRYLKNRKFTQNPALKNIASWGYWQGAGIYMPGTNRENAPWFEALTDETGWVWFIPLHTGVVSVGVVLSETSNRTKKAQAADAKAFYLSQLQLTPGLLKLLENAELVSDIKSAADYSYSTGDNQYAGPNFRLVGDAGAFIDPLFSSGVHLAFTYALSGATTIAASIRGHCTEEEAIKFHNQKVGVSYTRFLIVVLGIYKQIHAQGSDVLSDIHEDNFDRAFDFIRPVIQGDADTPWETQIQKAIDFLGTTPGVVGMDPAIQERLSKRVDASLLSDNGPFLPAQALAEASGDDPEAKELLERMNSRKAITGMYGWAENVEGDNLSGFAMVLKTGSLGLKRE